MSSELAATIWIGIGGALGGVTRYSIEQLMARLVGTAVWGTLLVNMLGSFLIGCFGAPVLTDVTIGVFGGFTTFAMSRPGAPTQPSQAEHRFARSPSVRCGCSRWRQLSPQFGFG
jgi:hypothetical protein